MSPMAIQAIVTLAVELTHAGLEINALVDEAKNNGGKLSDETMARVQQEVRDANDLWEN